MKEFRRLVTKICREDEIHGHIPDYAVRLVNGIVEFQNRDLQKNKPDRNKVVLYPETYHKAKIAAPGYDVYYLRQEWLNWWVESGKPEIKNPDSAFIGFCRKRYEMQPLS